MTRFGQDFAEGFVVMKHLQSYLRGCAVEVILMDT